MLYPIIVSISLLGLLSTDAAPLNPPESYTTDFIDRSEVLAQWTPQNICAHCKKQQQHLNQVHDLLNHVNGKEKDECTNMTLSATSFDTVNGMTHTTRSLPSSVATTCSTRKQVCSSGHMTWNPNLLYGNFTVSARWFPGSSSSLKTSTGFIGLDSPGNEASITMGFHGAGWLGGNDEGNHKYQHGIYSNVKDGHNREYTTTSKDLSTGFHTYGLLWTSTLVEWRLDGVVVRRVNDTSIIPQIPMQLRLHTRSGYCNKMVTGATFNASFNYFEYAKPGPPA